MAREEPLELKVIGSKRLTANMHRLTLGGEGMGDFPEGHEGGYIKSVSHMLMVIVQSPELTLCAFNERMRLMSISHCMVTGDRRHAGQLLVRMVRPLWQEAPAPKP